MGVRKLQGIPLEISADKDDSEQAQGRFRRGKGVLSEVAAKEAQPLVIYTVDQERNRSDCCVLCFEMMGMSAILGGCV